VLKDIAAAHDATPHQVALRFLVPGIPAFTIHDLRRTAASGLVALGVQLPVIEKVLNHQSGSFRGVCGVYQFHSYSAEKRAALSLGASTSKDFSRRRKACRSPREKGGDDQLRETLEDYNADLLCMSETRASSYCRVN
jgi:hypothetical protein